MKSFGKWSKFGNVVREKKRTWFERDTQIGKKGTKFERKALKEKDQGSKMFPIIIFVGHTRI